MTKKVMKLVNPITGKMKCKVCGSEHYANLRHGGGYVRGSWQCIHGCKLELTPPITSKAAIKIEPNGTRRTSPGVRVDDAEGSSVTVTSTAPTFRYPIERIRDQDD